MAPAVFSFFPISTPSLPTTLYKEQKQGENLQKSLNEKAISERKEPSKYPLFIK